MNQSHRNPMAGVMTLQLAILDRLWRKSWWETRWGFLTLLGVLLLLVVALPLLRPWKQPDLAEWTWWLQHYGLRRDEHTQFLALFSSYPGYVWGQWFYQSLAPAYPVYAILAAMTLKQLIGGAPSIFTFSLPVTRRKALLTHAAVVATETFLAVLVSSLMFPIASRLTEQWYPFGSAVIYSLLLALGGMAFIAFAFLLMVIFNSPWKAMAIGIPSVLASFGLGRPDHLGMFDEFPWWSVYHVMSGESYFRYGQIPWPGLFICLALSAALMVAAVRIYERRDF